MITPEFLQHCTDDQINKGVAWLDAGKAEYLTSDITFNINLASTQNSYKKSRLAWYKDDEPDFQPCTNPNDAWPIMMENLISTTPRGKSSYAKPYASSGMLAIISHCDSNSELLRAAMEVYILMECSK